MEIDASETAAPWGHKTRDHIPVAVPEAIFRPNDAIHRAIGTTLGDITHRGSIRRSAR